MQREAAEAREAAYGGKKAGERLTASTGKNGERLNVKDRKHQMRMRCALSVTPLTRQDKTRQRTRYAMPACRSERRAASGERRVGRHTVWPDP